MPSSAHRLAPCLPLLAVLACGPAPGSSLEHRVFLSQSVTEDGAPQPLVGDVQLMLQFHETPHVSASASCNTLRGEYSIDGDVFGMTDASQTAIGCDEERHARDDWYFGFLLSKPTIVVEGDTLVLDGDGARIEYLDQEAATPDVELVGPTWTVETIIEGEFASHSTWPSPASLVFGRDGVVTVNTGCNAGSGTYQVSGARVTFADVAVTERGCEDDTARLESAVLGVLHGPQPVTWEITVDRLSLQGADFGLGLVASDG